MLPRKLLLIAPYDDPKLQKWFSPGRQAKVGTVYGLLQDEFDSVLLISTIPYISPNPNSCHVLSYSDNALLRIYQSLLSCICLAFSLRKNAKCEFHIWIYNSRFTDLIYLLILRFLLSANTVTVEFEDLPHARQENSGLAGFLDDVSTYLLLKVSTGYTYVGKNMVSVLQQKYCKLLPNSLYLPPLLTEDFLLHLNNRLDPFSTSLTHITYSGGYEPEKGVALLLDAFSRLDNSYRLHLLGPVPDQIKTLQAYDPRISIPGFVDNDRYYRLLLQSDVLVNPHMPILNSSYIFPHKLIQIMASRSFMLTTRFIGYEEFSLPSVCLFQDSSELHTKLLHSRSLWRESRDQILALSDYLLEHFAVNSSKLRSELAELFNP